MFNSVLNKVVSLSKDQEQALIQCIYMNLNRKTAGILIALFTGVRIWCSHKFSSVFSFLQNNTLSRAELDATGDVLDIHYGDVLIKYRQNFNTLH